MVAQNETNQTPVWTKTKVEELICEVMGLEHITPLISSQLYKFTTEYKMTYKEIARCIVWYVEVEKKKFDKAYYGIGLIPNIREQANQYYEKQKQIQLEKERIQAEKEREAKEIAAAQDDTIIFNINYIKKKPRKVKFFNIADIDVGNSNNGSRQK